MNKQCVTWTKKDMNGKEDGDPGGQTPAKKKPALALGASSPSSASPLRRASPRLPRAVRMPPYPSTYCDDSLSSLPPPNPNANTMEAIMPGPYQT